MARAERRCSYCRRGMHSSHRLEKAGIRSREGNFPAMAALQKNVAGRKHGRIGGGRPGEGQTRLGQDQDRKGDEPVSEKRSSKRKK